MAEHVLQLECDSYISITYKDRHIVYSYVQRFGYFLMSISPLNTQLKCDKTTHYHLLIMIESLVNNIYNFLWFLDVQNLQCLDVMFHYKLIRT